MICSVRSLLKSKLVEYYSLLSRTLHHDLDNLENLFRTNAWGGTEKKDDTEIFHGSLHVDELVEIFEKIRY